jgi:glycosyltransferase involved in cell wall biosynthesis
VKDSLAASALAAVETWHHTQRRLYPGTVKRFLCPSDFLRRKYVEWGWSAEQLEHFPNFVDLDTFAPAPEPRDAAYLYFGRLSREKGVHTLLAAHGEWSRRRAAAGRPAPRLRIAGTGPDEALLRAAAPDDVEFLGPLPPDRLRDVLRRARFTVLPSECYENGSLSLLESLACGVPVVGSDLGGIPEHLEDGRTGVLFAAGDAEALAAALERADGLPDTSRTAARAAAEAAYGRSAHLDRLEALLLETADR